MKKIISALICALVLLLLFPLTAYADMGPKPSVVVDFDGLSGKTYYATLLSSEKSTGPYSAIDNGDYTNADYKEGDENFDIFLKFAEYKDADGFYFLQFFNDCSQNHRLSWTYYPPDKFKILLYFPETDQFVVSSETYETYAFDSYYTYTYANEGLSINPAMAVPSPADITVEKSYDHIHEILAMFGRMLLTIAAELVIALLFGFFERKLIVFIILVNAVTQVALNLLLYFINYYSGAMMFVVSYALLEIGVFIIEAVLFTWYFKKHSKKPVPGWKSWLYAFLANAASFILGVVLSF